MRDIKPIKGKLFRIVCIKALLLSLLISQSCATAVNEKLAIAGTKQRPKVALLVNFVREDFKILDHTGNLGKTYIDPQQVGYVGILVEQLIIGLITEHEKSASLGGDPGELMSKVKDLNMQEYFYRLLSDTLGKDFDIIDLRSRPDFWARYRASTRERLLKKNISLEESKALGADFLLHVDCIFGLAVYSDEKSSAATDVNIELYGVDSSKLLGKAFIASDQYYKRGNVVDAFTAENAKLFKRDIKRAAYVTSLQIANELGAKHAMPEYNDDPEMADIKMGMELISNCDDIGAFSSNCDEPFKLIDCSFWTGATRKISIYDVKCRIAGTEDGKIILLMGDDIYETGKYKNELIAKSLVYILRELNKHGIQAKPTLKSESMGTIVGIIIEADKDGYSLLKRFTDMGP